LVGVFLLSLSLPCADGTLPGLFLGEVANFYFKPLPSLVGVFLLSLSLPAQMVPYQGYSRARSPTFISNPFLNWLGFFYCH
jgi:hypothetical protein